jgi:hypothetical protein
MRKRGNTLEGHKKILQDRIDTIDNKNSMTEP